jgi:rhodanese-related sulfurtransferase
MKLVKKSTVNFNTIDPGKVCDYVAGHPGVILLDVRTKEEFENTSHPEHGTLRNAINIPIQELEGRLSEIDQFKNTEIIVYCSHSKRSPRASQLLVQSGFTKVTNMEGGMSVMNDDECVIRKK